MLPQRNSSAELLTATMTVLDNSVCVPLWTFSSGAVTSNTMCTDSAGGASPCNVSP